ncbi:MAG: ankyrin repeat domain-containing protein [Planctomycetota bacterium]|jgi:hypothetical protein
MKFSLPLKLAVFVILLFALVIVACIFWTPLRVRYYTAKLKSDNPKERVAGVSGLLGMGKKGADALAETMNLKKPAVDFLTKHWSRVNGRIRHQWAWNHSTDCNPLHLAAKKGYLTIAGLLIVKGAEVNGKDEYGETPLFWATRHGQKAVAELLIVKGAEVNAKDNDGRAPLHTAASRGQKDIGELLIAKGAKVTPKQEGGWTPMHRAASGGHKDVVELLITKGAEINSRNMYGKTPLDEALSKEMKSLLRAHGGKSGAELKKESDKK